MFPTTNDNNTTPSLVALASPLPKSQFDDKGESLQLNFILMKNINESKVKSGPFSYGYRSHGAQWLHNHGLIPPVERPDGELFGLLYVRLEPCGDMTLLNVLWFRHFFYGELGVDINKFQYTFDGDRIVRKHANSFRKLKDLPPPDVNDMRFPRMDDMIQQTFRGPATMRILDQTGDYYSEPDARLPWTLVETINGNAPSELGVSVTKLSDNEWVIGQNMIALAHDRLSTASNRATHN